MSGRQPRCITGLLYSSGLVHSASIAESATVSPGGQVDCIQLRQKFARGPAASFSLRSGSAAKLRRSWGVAPARAIPRIAYGIFALGALPPNPRDTPRMIREAACAGFWLGFLFGWFVGVR